MRTTIFARATMFIMQTAERFDENLIEVSLSAAGFDSPRLQVVHRRPLTNNPLV
jgi:hypothetical protein